MGEVLEFKRNDSEEALLKREHSPKDEAAYFEEKQNEIMRGNDTWIVRDFNDDRGRLYDFYRRTIRSGYVNHEFDTKTYEGFAFNFESIEPISVYDGMSLAEATKAVEAFEPSDI